MRILKRILPLLAVLVFVQLTGCATTIATNQAMTAVNQSDAERNAQTIANAMDATTCGSQYAGEVLGEGAYVNVFTESTTLRNGELSQHPHYGDVNNRRQFGTRYGRGYGRQNWRNQGNVGYGVTDRVYVDSRTFDMTVLCRPAGMKQNEPAARSNITTTTPEVQLEPKIQRQMTPAEWREQKNGVTR